MSKFTLIVAIASLAICNLFAQDSTQLWNFADRYQRIDASYIFGGQVYNNNFIYNPGFSFQASCGIKLGEFAGIGLGSGYYVLQDEHFVPFFVEAFGCRKNKSASPMVAMQFGYSLGWFSGHTPEEKYDFSGGVFIDAGLGRKVTINRQFSVYFHWSYRHQFARMSYEVFGGHQYTEPLNYDMLVITLGLIRHSK
jgi:hypothetical protein